jgi:hypothetical protein
VIEKHDHVDFSIVSARWGCDDSVQSDKRRSKVVQSGGRNELLVKADETGRLGVDNIKLKVNDLFRGNLEMACNERQQRGVMLVITTVDIFS